jgi:hypothetical protein
MAKGRVRYRPRMANLKRCSQCGSESAFIYRSEDGKDQCVVCVIKEPKRGDASLRGSLPLTKGKGVD